MVIDANGFTVPYQRIDSSKLIFMLNIKSATAKRYTFKSTDLEIKFDTVVRCFRNEAGDVFWENDKAIYRMHGSNVKGPGGGIDYIAKKHGAFLDKDSITSNDSFNEGNTLGCGGVAPYNNGHLIRYGNFEKMELLDSGPIYLRMRFSFPEFDLEGHKVHEERTISMVAGQIFSKIECSFIGVDSSMSVSLAYGIPYKDVKGCPVDSAQASNNYYSMSTLQGKGTMCYAENFCGKNIGTTYSAVITGKRGSYNVVEADGHSLITEQYDISEPFVYYQGATTSVAGMNFLMWQDFATDFSNHVKSQLTITSYESE